MRRLLPALAVVAAFAAPALHAQSYPSHHPSIVAGEDSEGLDRACQVKARLDELLIGGQRHDAHLTGELFKLRTGTNIVHVPYKGSAPSLTALLGGEVEMTFANIPAISSHVKSKRLRALANAGTKRSDQMPEVPTLKESGVSGVEVVVWYGVLARYPPAVDRPGRRTCRQLARGILEAVARRSDAVGRSG